MVLSIVVSIVIGGLAGWIASSLMKSNTGLVANIVLGIVGAVLLNVILIWAGTYAESAWLPQILVGIAGAAGLIFIGGAVRR